MVAEYVDSSESGFKKWENGEHPIPECALIKLAQLYQDESLPLRYLGATSEVWKRLVQPLLASLELRKVCEQMRTIMPHITTFIDMSTQVIS